MLDSAHSRSGSESPTMPQPTNRLRLVALDDPGPDGDHELAVAVASSQPTGPAYQPRSRCSCSSSSSRAAARGQPPTAGVGMEPVDQVQDARGRRAARPRPRSRGAAGWAAAQMCGRRARCPGVTASGARVSRSMSTTTACSSRSFSDASRAPPSSRIDAGVGAPGRRARRARWSGTARPRAATRRSGEAPRNVRSPRPNANTVTGSRGVGDPRPARPAAPARR